MKEEKQKEKEVTWEEVKDLFLETYDGSNNLSFDDIILIDSNEYIKNTMKDFMTEFANADTLYNYNLGTTKTLLFTGAPGLGKTFLTKVIASELKIPLYIIDISSLLKNAEAGLSNLKLVYSFVENQKNQPCILFMDECDGIAKSRENKNVEEGVKRCTNFIMQRLQEINDNKESKLIVVAASNYADGLDQAFMSRFAIQTTFYLPENYIPFIETQVAKNNMFRLEKDCDEEIIKIVNTYANKSEFSIRQLNAKILWCFKQEILRRVENNAIDGDVIPIKLSSILQEIARECKVDINIKELMESETEKPTFDEIMENN